MQLSCMYAHLLNREDTYPPTAEAAMRRAAAEADRGAGGGAPLRGATAAVSLRGAAQQKVHVCTTIVRIQCLYTHASSGVCAKFPWHNLLRPFSTQGTCNDLIT
jgi:hypothetical protein